MVVDSLAELAQQQEYSNLFTTPGKKDNPGRITSLSRIDAVAYDGYPSGDVLSSVATKNQEWDQSPFFATLPTREAMLTSLPPVAVRRGQNMRSRICPSPRKRLSDDQGYAGSTNRSDILENSVVAAPGTESISGLRTPVAPLKSLNTALSTEHRGLSLLDVDTPTSLAAGASSVAATPQVDVVREQVEYFFATQPGIADMIRHSRDCMGDWTATRETAHLDLDMDRSGATYFNQYLLVKSLGSGTHGSVKLCVNTTNGKLYAVKLIPRQFQHRQLGRRRRRGAGGVDRQLREIAILKKMDHVNIVKLHEVVVDPSSRYLLLVMEYAENGTVIQRLPDADAEPRFQALNEGAARAYFRDMCAGMDYMHYNKIIHADLKPENILIGADGRVKLSDFGCSFVFHQRPDTPHETVEKGKQHGSIVWWGDDAIEGHPRPMMGGSPAFHAPEMIANAEYNPYFTDLWALGVCLYCMTCGRLPFSGATTSEMYTAIREQELTFPDDVDLSPLLKDLLHTMLVKDTAQRPTMEEIMRHPWVSNDGQNVRNLASMELPPAILSARVSLSEMEAAVVSRDADIAYVPTRLRSRHFRDGEYLVRRGEGSRVMYFIVSGVVNVMLDAAAVACRRSNIPLLDPQLADTASTQAACAGGGANGAGPAPQQPPESSSVRPTKAASFTGTSALGGCGGSSNHAASHAVLSPKLAVNPNLSQESLPTCIKGLESLVHAATEATASASFSAADGSHPHGGGIAEDAASGVDDSAENRADSDEHAEPVTDDGHSDKLVFEFEVDGALASPNKGAEVDPRMLLEGGHVTLSQGEALAVFRRVQSIHLENGGHVVEQLGPGKLCGSVPGVDPYQLFSVRAQGDVEALVLTQEEFLSAWGICCQQLQMRRLRSDQRFRSCGDLQQLDSEG